MQQAVVYIKAAFVATTRAEITAFRDIEKCHDARGLSLRRKRMVVMRMRLEAARARQRSSVHQFFRAWVQVSLFAVDGLDSIGSAASRRVC